MLADQAGNEGHAAGDDVAAALHKAQQGASAGRVRHVVHADDQRQGEQGTDAAAQQDHGGQRQLRRSGKRWMMLEITSPASTSTKVRAPSSKPLSAALQPSSV